MLKKHICFPHVHVYLHSSHSACMYVHTYAGKQHGNTCQCEKCNYCVCVCI